MPKPIKRFISGELLMRAGKQPIAFLDVQGVSTFIRTSRVIEVTFGEDGTPIRIETLNSIYVQVLE